MHADKVSPTDPSELSCVSDPLDAYAEPDVLFDELVQVAREPLLVDKAEAGLLKGGHVVDEADGTFRSVKVLDGAKLQAVARAKPDGSDLIAAVNHCRASSKDLELNIVEEISKVQITIRLAEGPLRLEAWMVVAGRRLSNDAAAKGIEFSFLEKVLARLLLRGAPSALGSNTTLFLSAANARALFQPSAASRPWVEFELGRAARVTSVQTKCRAEEPQWLEAFTLSSSEDGREWTEHGATLGGSGDGTLAEVEVEPPIMSRLVRLTPRKWHLPELARDAVAPQPCSVASFRVLPGLIIGEDIAIEEMTLEEAKVRATELEGCRAFTFECRGSLRPQGRVKVHFKRIPWVTARGMELGWVACLCDASAAGLVTTLRPSAPPPVERLGVLDSARPTECATLSYVFERPLDGMQLREAFGRVVDKNPLLAGRLHRSRPVWRWEVRMGEAVGCAFRAQVLPVAAHIWFDDLVGKPGKALEEFGHLRGVHQHLVLKHPDGDVALMEQGTAPLCYLTHSIGARYCMVSLSISQKLADECALRALFRCLEEEFSSPGSSAALAGPASADAAFQGMQVVSGRSGKPRVHYTLERYRPPSHEGFSLASLGRLLRRLPCGRRQPAAAPRHIVTVQVAEEALASIRAAAGGAGLSAALAAWVGDAVHSPCVRVALSYRGLAEGVPGNYLGNATGLQDCLPSLLTGRFSARSVEAALADLGHNFRHSVDTLPEASDTALFFTEDPQYFPRLGSGSVLAFPPIPWGSLDAGGVHRLFCCAPGLHAVTHTVLGREVALRLQAAWRGLGQQAFILEA